MGRESLLVNKLTFKAGVYETSPAFGEVAASSGNAKTARLESLLPSATFYGSALLVGNGRLPCSNRAQPVS